MGLRTFLRNWLGVEEYKKSVVTHERLKDEVVKAIENAFSEDGINYYDYSFYRNKAKPAIKRAFRESAINIMQEEIAKFDREEFIDSIVDRIKRKQLK